MSLKEVIYGDVEGNGKQLLQSLGDFLVLKGPEGLYTRGDYTRIANELLAPSAPFSTKKARAPAGLLFPYAMENPIEKSIAWKLGL